MLIIYVPQIKETKRCSSHRIPEKDLEDAVLVMLKQHIQNILHLKKSPGICWYCAISGDQYEEAAGQAGEEKTGDRTL